MEAVETVLVLILISTNYIRRLTMAKVEKLSPKHPDWIWLKTPEEQLMQERSTPYDSKVSPHPAFSLIYLFNFHLSSILGMMTYGDDDLRHHHYLLFLFLSVLLPLRPSQLALRTLELLLRPS